MKGKVRVQKNRVVLAAIAISVFILGADTVKRELFRKDTLSIVTVEGVFNKAGDTTEQASTMPTNISGEPEPYTNFVENEGFKEENISANDISKGLLLQTDAAHPVSQADSSSLVDLNGCANEYYTVLENCTYLSKEAADALNSMMAAYNSETGLDDFVVYGTTATFTGTGSVCRRYFQERAAGNTVDLALVGCGSVIGYDGEDEEGWIVKNCHKYGFIVRYPENKSDRTGEEYCPWHLRYVGKVHASNMAASGLCLEEYLEFLKNYTYSSPYKCNVDGQECDIYYIKSEGDITVGLVPIGGDYDISGNNTDGFIVTICK